MLFRRMVRAFLLICALVATIFPAVNQDKRSGDAPPAIEGKPIVLADGLKIWDIRQGTGDRAIPGMDLTVQYTGWLANGKKFESSLDEGKPFKFRLGAHQVIKGWDEGIYGMHAGGKRRLEIPPDLAYGGKRRGDIPPNSTLIFDIELLRVD